MLIVPVLFRLLFQPYPIENKSYTTKWNNGTIKMTKNMKIAI